MGAVVIDLALPLGVRVVSRGETLAGEGCPGDGGVRWVVSPCGSWYLVLTLGNTYNTIRGEKLSYRVLTRPTQRNKTQKCSSSLTDTLGVTEQIFLQNTVYIDFMHGLFSSRDSKQQLQYSSLQV